MTEITLEAIKKKTKIGYMTESQTFSVQDALSVSIIFYDIPKSKEIEFYLLRSSKQHNTFLCPNNLLAIF